MAASIQSPYPDVEIPDVPLTQFVYADAASRGDRTAIVCGSTGRSYSYAMLDHLVGRCAAGLVERGLQQHEVVGIFAPNVPEYPIAFHGVAQAGATNTTVNSLSNAHELAFQLRNAHARFLITIPQFLDRALPAAAEAGIEEVYVFGEAEGATPFASLLATGAPVPQPEIDARQRPGVAAVLERHHRPAQGRDADAPEPRREHDAVRRLPRRRPRRPRDRLPAVLPHLRPDRGPERLPAPRRGDRDHAALRAGAVPAADPGPQDHDRLRSAAGRGRAGQAPARRQLRPVVAAHDHVGRRAARQRPAARVRRAARHRGLPGLRPHRDESRHPRVAQRRTLHTGRRRNAPGEHRGTYRGPRNGHRRRPRRALDPRAAGDGRLSRECRGDCSDHRCGRLAADRGHRDGGRERDLPDRRSAQGADQVQRLPGAAGRARGRAADEPGDRRRRRDRRAGRGVRRDPEGLRRAEGRRRDDPGRGDGLRRRRTCRRTSASAPASSSTRYRSRRRARSCAAC